MLAHNLYELPLSPIDLGNSGPIAFAAILGVAYALRPDSKAVAAAALAWGVLNLVIGGVVTVLPLSILPFVPEQSVTHYGAHVVYTLGQVPLVVVGYRALGGRAVAAQPAGTSSRVTRPTSGTRIPTRVGSLAVRVLGDGPPAVLWHSLFVDERSWQRVEDALARDRCLVIITGPGHGESSDPGHRYSLDDCAAAAGEVLAALGIDEPVDWVGNAWGGHVGWCSRRLGRTDAGPWSRSGRRSRPTAGPSDGCSACCSPSTASPA